MRSRDQIPRLRMRLPLSQRDLSGPWRKRWVDPADVPALGTLMLAAYRGTVDDEGETLTDAAAEVERTLTGEYGLFLADCSFLAIEARRNVGASLVTLSEGRALLAHLIVHPNFKRRGIGSFLVAATGNALLTAGYSDLDLLVTEANEPAVNLYRKLGFRVLDRLTAPPGSA